MASTYSALKIELIGTGDQTGTWGATTNVNLGDAALGEAITGSADVAFSSADVTITLTDTNATQTARNLRLNLTGTSGGARNLILGSGCQIEKLYLVNNGLADAVTVKNTTGTGIAVAAGKTMFVYNNGTNVVDAITHLTSLTTGVLSASGATTFTAGTASTSTTTGTAVITGGLGVSGRVNAANFDGIVGANTAAAGSFTTINASTSITNAGLTSGRVTYAGASGLLSDSANLTFDGATLTTSNGSGAAGLIVNSSANTPYLRFDQTSAAKFTIGESSIVGGGAGFYDFYAVASVGQRFWTGATQRMTITSAGLVGIGVSNPTQILQISGGAVATEFDMFVGATRTGTLYVDATQFIISAPTAVGMYFQTNATNRMLIDAPGNVGIGPSSPAARLDVTTSTAGFAAILTNTNGASDSNGLNIRAGTVSSEYNLRLSNASNTVDFMVVKGNGNVGIGVSSPTSPTGFTTNRTLLQITNASDTGQLVLGSTANGLMLDYSNSTGDVTIRNGYGATSATALINIDSGTLVFRTGTSYTERMRIDSSGSLLVGTSGAPTAGGLSRSVVSFKQLNDSGTSANIIYSSGIQLEANGNTNVLSIGYDGSSFGFNASYRTTGGYVPMVFCTGGPERMRLDTSGNLLVGTTSYSGVQIGVGYAGNVNTGIGLNDTTSTSGCGFAQFQIGGTTIGSITRVGATSAVVYNTTSDERLKSNVTDSESVIDKLMQVKVRQYNWTEGEVHQDYGFIAQELEPILSGIVTKGKTEKDMWQLDYSKITPHLVKAIQEQQALIESLTTRLTALENK